MKFILVILLFCSCSTIDRGYIAKKIYKNSYIIQYDEKNLIIPETFYFKIKGVNKKGNYKVITIKVSEKEYLQYMYYDYYIITRKEKEKIIRNLD